MKKALLITTAVVSLVAGANLASAQRLDEPHPAPAATTAPDQKSPEGKVSEREPQKTDSAKPVPHAQVPDAQAPGKATGSKPMTSAQGAGTKGSQKDDTQFPSNSAGPKTSEPERAQLPGKTGASSTTVQEESKSVVSKPLSSEQHARIRDSLRGEKSEHLARGSLSVSVGEAIPRTIHLYTFPQTFVESFPEYRSYEYIMVGDEILIVDPQTLRVIAVIPA